MPWQYNPYIIPSIISAVVAFVVAFAAWRRRGVPGAVSLALLMLSAGTWALAYTIELSVSSLQAQIFWSKVEYLGIVNIPVLYLVFALEYAQQDRFLTRRNILLFWVVPILTLILTWTNELHALIWSSFRQIELNNNLILSVDHGVVFWVYAAYSYLLLLLGAIVLIQRAITAKGEYRSQAAVMVLGTAVTWIGNIVYLTGLSPIPEIDTTSLTITITGLIFAWGLFRLGLLDLVPIAGETVLESLDDGALVLDQLNRVVYLNKAFEYYTNTWAEEAIGKPAEKALAELPGLYSVNADSEHVNTDISLDRGDGRKLFLNLRISPIQDADEKVVGRVFMLHDITERKQAEQRLLPPEDARGSQIAAIPVIFVFRMEDGKIIEVNRSFIVSLGFQREEVIGRTPLEIGMWTADQRSTLLRDLREKDRLSDYPIEIGVHSGGKRSYLLSANTMIMDGESYMVWIMRQVK
jgi:PAS domain S-box-containing protein